MYSSEAFYKLERAHSKRVDQVQSLTAQLKSAEEEGAASKKEVAESNARAKQLERKWFESNHKLAETEKELEALRLDFSKVAQERDELKACSDKWPAKKAIVYHKGVMASFLKAQNEMKKQVKAGKTDWSDPEPSEDEEDDQDSGEISSDEGEPAGETRRLGKKLKQSRPSPHQTRRRLIKSSPSNLQTLLKRLWRSLILERPVRAEQLMI